MYATSWNDKKNKAIISNCGTSNATDPALRRRISTKMNRDTGEFFSSKGKKSIPRNDIVKRFHEHFGAVDINNHYRQGGLAFERQWKTKKFHHRFFMTLLGVCITNAFLMYKLEYKDSHRNSEVDMMDFTSFLDKLAYQMIFYGKYAKPDGGENVAFSKEKTKKRSHSISNSKSDDDGDDEAENEHNLAHFDGSHESSTKQVTRRNCRICNDHRTMYYCVDCSGDGEENLLWICSPCPVKNTVKERSKANNFNNSSSGGGRARDRDSEDDDVNESLNQCGVSRQCYAQHIRKKINYTNFKNLKSKKHRVANTSSDSD